LFPETVNGGGAWKILKVKGGLKKKKKKEITLLNNNARKFKTATLVP
jgi:hypothetical protein